MNAGLKALLTVAAVGVSAVGTGVAVLVERRRDAARRQPLEAAYDLAPRRPNLSGLAPAAPAAPVSGVPNPAESGAAAALVKAGHDAVAEVVANAKTNRVASMEAYGRAWRLFGEASRAAASLSGGKEQTLAAELRRLELKLQSLQSQAAAILRKVPSWLTF